MGNMMINHDFFLGGPPRAVPTVPMSHLILPIEHQNAPHFYPQILDGWNLD